ncbi:hypothetical protein VCR12J2_1010149 [Vibrio coralliirubri]|uniref:hypothetical protein n=1 Tax=Vibrio coralliirubri TaxID=1516159 RepID=UPI0006301CB5|nr:hypothetical protein [Vibrio coralliirubri]CDT77927.1 hypothetical protein VCR12J2_1010149 [Vibrio coralliirubri]
MDIILHIGLPKTGSSALQQYLFDNRDWLAGHKVYYPEHVTSKANPKHQWLTTSILKSEFQELQNVLSNSKGYKRVILSTESISNDLYNYKSEALDEFLSILCSFGRLKLCIVDRDKYKWAKSYYKQAILNQDSARMPFYSTADDFSTFVSDVTISKFMCRAQLLSDIESSFNAPIKRFNYEEHDIVEIAHWLTGLELPQFTLTNKNDSISDAAAEVMCQLNAKIVSRREKYAWTKVLLDTCPNSSAVMHSLSNRADSSTIASLDTTVLDSIKVRRNPPLSYCDQDILDIIGLMRNYLIEFKS